MGSVLLVSSSDKESKIATQLLKESGYTCIVLKAGAMQGGLKKITAMI